MFSDVIPCGTTFSLPHAFRSHKGLPVMCKGLYVMHKGLPVMCEGFVCHAATLLQS